jgi:hypothetical protein
MRAAVGLLLLGLVLGAARAHAEHLPAKNQAPLLLRILAYDDNLGKRAEPKVVTVLVVYKKDSADSESSARGIHAALQELARTTSVGGRPVQALLVPYVAKTFDADTAKGKVGKVAGVYLSSGLDDALKAIVKITRSRSMLSFTGTEAYGSMLGLVLTVRDGKSAILVNLPVAKEEGAQLHAALLRAAKEVKR